MSLNANQVIKNIHEYRSTLQALDYSSILDTIQDLLDSSGIMFRIFSRKKKTHSICTKMEKKAEDYIANGKKMQDLFGIRIVLYFAEDIQICIDALKDTFQCVDESIDSIDPTIFSPQRINLVFNIPDENTIVPPEIQSNCLIDNTFEVQFRTIFSEGWHEVEHDLRYKYKEDWEDEKDMARDLNGVLAVLEICDKNIAGIFDNVAYNKYKKHSWDAMLRNRFRLRFLPVPLSHSLISVLDNNPDIAKTIFRFPKACLAKLFQESKLSITYDNAIFLINHFTIKNININSIMPFNIKDTLMHIPKIQLKGKVFPYQSIMSMDYTP